jgi:DNA-binding MarR family transcriptional regulator
VSREAGLADPRDWLVLALVQRRRARTQLEIAAQLGIDKSTLCHCLTGWNGTG